MIGPEMDGAFAIDELDDDPPLRPLRCTEPSST